MYTAGFFLIGWPYVGMAPGAAEYVRSVSWLDGIEGDLKQALVLLGLVLCTFAVFSHYCSGVLCCHLVVVTFGFTSSSQMIGWRFGLVVTRWLRSM